MAQHRCDAVIVAHDWKDARKNKDLSSCKNTQLG